MGFFRTIGKAGVKLVLHISGLFVQAMKTQEAKVMLRELKEIDEKVAQKLISKKEAKVEFLHSLHKLENTILRLKQESEEFEAQHLYHVYERYAKSFNDEKLSKHLLKIHP